MRLYLADSNTSKYKATPLYSILRARYSGFKVDLRLQYYESPEKKKAVSDDTAFYKFCNKTYLASVAGAAGAAGAGCGA